MFYKYIFPNLLLDFSLFLWYFSKNLLKFLCNQMVGFFMLFKILQSVYDISTLR